MAESSLSLTFNDFLQAVGVFLGYDRNTYSYTTGTAGEWQECNRYVQSGYRQFLLPEPIREGEPPHKWSFLSPVSSITTAADDMDYDLPDDFGGLSGGTLTVYDEDNIDFPVEIRGEGQLRALHAQSSTLSGRPKFVAVRPLAADETTGQRWELIVYPTPDGAYVIHDPYIVIVNDLDRTDLYPLGGAYHAEAIMEQCLSVAEIRGKNREGVHTQAARRLMKRSIMHDKEVMEARTLGYCGDGETVIATKRSGVPTYDGTAYGPYAP